MKHLIYLVTFLFLGHFSYSQDWIFACSSKKGDDFWIKSNYVSKGGGYGNDNIIKVWTKNEAKESMILKNGKKVKVFNVKILSLSEYDCAEKRTKIISMTTYDKNGEVIENFKVPEYDQEWSEIVPDSIGEGILDKVCQLFL